jgi:tRNA-2-methylthio-N6-dimethylallyladenosine synthase
VPIEADHRVAEAWQHPAKAPIQTELLNFAVQPEIAMTVRRLFIFTIGCQMNTYDSDKIEAMLRPWGYRRTDCLEQAELIIANTCTIRQKAEQKAFSFLGRLAELKRHNPDLVVGIGGCLAQQEGDRILKRMPHIDLVFGTQTLGRLPQMIARIRETRCRIVDVGLSEPIAANEDLAPAPRADQVSAFVTIMRGCDNYCSYCVVPYVRGREASRRPKEIVDEIRMLVDVGIKEVTLLGQNVNSYGKKEAAGTFAELLERIQAIEGLLRIRFTTSHPKDLSDGLIAAFKDLGKLCRHIHLPVQSGSNRILARMNRKYDREHYLERVARLRSQCPDIAITSDIIVGFPGESESDFEQTLALIRQVQYDGLFAFMYSDRPQAPAARFGDKIGQSVKKARLQAVLDLQQDITHRKHAALVGTIQQVLVEGFSKREEPTEAIVPSSTPLAAKSALQWTGRTSTNVIVNFVQPENHPGQGQELTGSLVDVMVEKGLAHCAVGRQAATQPFAQGLKGDHCYAA